MRTTMRKAWLLYLLIPFLLSHCSFEKPSAPSWDVEVALPLISKSYTMAEIAEDESSVSLDDSGLVNLEVEAKLDSYYVGDQLTLSSLQKSFGLSLGTFTIDAPGSEQTQVPLREIFSQADAFDGQTVVVPPFSFASDRKTLAPYPNFTYAVIDSGQLLLRVTNDLPVPLGSPLTLEVWDATADTVILSKTRAVSVGPGESKVFLVNLENRRLTHTLSVRILGDSPGSGGQPVTVDADATFEVRAEVGDLKVREALAEIPTQSVSDAELVQITEPLEIREARLESGMAQLQIQGSLPVDAMVTYRLWDFIRPDSTTLTGSFFLGKDSGALVNIDLSGLTLKPVPSAIGEQTLRFEWSAQTVDTGPQQVLVQASDFIDADLTVSDVRFAEITGRIGEKKVDISQSTIEFDIPVDLDSIYFETASLELWLQNGINFPATVDVMIEGQNNNGAVSQLTISETIQSAEAPGVPTTSLIALNQQNSNIREFISILPSLLRVYGDARLGADSWVGTVTKDDFISGTVKLVAPLALRLPPQNIDSDVNEVAIDQDVKDDLRDNLSSGRFFVELRNHLPLGAEVEFFFAETDAAVFDSPTLRVGPIRSDGGVVDDTGFVVAPQQSDVTLELSESQMQTFLQDRLFAGVRVRVDGTDGKFVKLRGSDYIHIQSYAKVKMKVN